MTIAERIAAAAGDANALLALAIELAAENARLSGAADALALADAERRAGQARRTRLHRQGRDHGNVTSRDGTLPSVTSQPPSPPSFPSSPPDPHNNPSFPPFPASAASAGTPEADAQEAEVRLADRLPEADRRVVRHFLALVPDAVARMSWVGRLGRLMDSQPHFTAAELGEGLEALMTQPRELWKPSVLKIWVARVRADAAREVLAEAEQAVGLRAGQGARGAAGVTGGIAGRTANAEAAWQYVSGELLRKQVQRTITMDDLGALGPRSRAALRAVGGLQTLAQTAADKMHFAERKFTRTFIDAHLTPTTTELPTDAPAESENVA